MKVRFLALSALALASVSSVVSAIPIASGVTAPAVFESDPNGGITIASQVQPFATSNYTGRLTSTVIRGDASNPYGLNGLTFTYKLENDPAGANAITRLTIGGYSGYATDMSYKFGTGDVSPAFMDRDSGGGVIGFSFLGVPVGQGTLTQGKSTQLLVVQTNATDHTPRIANLINAAVSTVNTYGPAGTLVPEPTTLAALGAAVALVVRRNRR
jgi:hypothetical protein